MIQQRKIDEHTIVINTTESETGEFAEGNLDCPGGGITGMITGGDGQGSNFR